MNFVKNSRFEVFTPTGWSHFDGIKVTKKEARKIVFDDSTSIVTSDSHLLKSECGFIESSTLRSGDVILPNKKVTSNERVEEVELYDLINVSKNHEYYTDDVISHNCAWIQDFDSLWIGLSPTISTGGSAILLSTPNGVGGQYHKIWTEAESGVNSFNPIRLPWNVHPEHDEEWFKRETLNLSKRQIAQEFECDFVSSGETYLQPDVMEKLRADIRQPVEKLERNKNIWVWKQPVHDHRYVVSADVSRGDSNDYSTFHVIDTNESEVVAEFKGKITPDRLAELLFDIGTQYNKALLCPENNTFGYTTCTRLKEKGYSRLFYSSARGDIFDYIPLDPDELPGFTTHQKSRVQILTNLEEMIRNRSIAIYSQRMYDELQTFMWHGARAQAAKGYNDDLVMSLAIGVWVGLGRSSTETSGEIAQALIKASGIIRSEFEPDTRNVGPPKTHWSTFHQQAVSRDYGKPKDPANLQHPEHHKLNDFSWLLR